MIFLLTLFYLITARPSLAFQQQGSLLFLRPRSYFTATMQQMSSSMENKLLSFSKWQYNEYNQVGKDYAQKEEVDLYETSHADFRDLVAEANVILDKVQISKEDILMDFGCGTGILVMEAARRGCQKAIGIDVSEAMLNHAKHQSNENLKNCNIEFHQGGFLTYSPDNNNVDVITTSFALHHLPDFWKGIGLRRLYNMLKPGGKLYIHDVVMQTTTTTNDYNNAVDNNDFALNNIAKFVENQANLGGEFLRQDAEMHFREEFSTCDWIMEGLLVRNGFEIVSKSYEENGVIADYLCIKK